MGIASLIGFAAFVLASLVVGSRLLLLARRTRQLPETTLGSALVLGGGVGYLLMVLALDILPRRFAPPALLAANLSLHAGALSLAVGTARIFRPGEARGRGAIAAIALTFGVSFALRLWDPSRIPPAPAVFWTATLGGMAAYAWSAWEAGSYAARLRRRTRVGLAEPEIVRRIGLWSAASAAAVAIHWASALNRLLGVQGTHPLLLAVSSALGLGAGACLWLAFLRGSAPDETRPIPGQPTRCGS